jgi:hypothetical protein
MKFYQVDVKVKKTQSKEGEGYHITTPSCIETNNEMHTRDAIFYFSELELNKALSEFDYTEIETLLIKETDLFEPFAPQEPPQDALPYYFNKVTDIRELLLNHPDQAMVERACLHFLGDEHQDAVDLYKAVKEDRVKLIPPRTWQPLYTCPLFEDVLLLFADGHITVGHQNKPSGFAYQSIQEGTLIAWCPIPDIQKYLKRFYKDE